MRLRLFPVFFWSVLLSACSSDPAPSDPAPNGGGSAGQNTSPGGNAQGGQVVGGGQAGVGPGGSTSTAGAGGSGGTTVAGGSGGSGGTKPEPTCTDATLRTGPPAGKEELAAAPVDSKFPFSQHWVGRFSDNPSAVGITGMADFDNDGDLDFASGQRGGPMMWWEYCSPDHWVQHEVGSGHNSPGGGNAMDADEDGWVDLIAGDSWYKNPGNPRETTWMRYGLGVTGGAEDIAVGDVSGDGKPDVVWVYMQIDAQWRSPGADPTAEWPLGATFEHRQQQGGFIGDVDGDTDNDVLVGNQYWYRNLDGLGTQWETVNFPNAFDDSPLTTMGDLDGDDDLDFAMITHFGNRVAWFENTAADGTAFTYHELAADKSVLHAVYALDFDNDGDIDLYAGQSTGEAWMYENVDGSGPSMEHAVAINARGHDARVGDVDCDGDLDIVGKPWGEGEAEIRDHVYLKNNLVENGGPAVFTRPPGEVWHPVQQRPYCP